MNSPFRILHLEDNANDVALVQSTLEAGGFSFTTTRVQNQNDFVVALERGGIDLILSDFSLPAFDGLSAMEIARTQLPAVPFIFVSGTLGKERAVTALKNGATGYVRKNDLGRLAPVVRRALRKVEEKAEVMFPVTADHYLAMACLPIDGRWQTEAQLVGQTQLGNRTRPIYRDLVKAGFCERKAVPILCDWSGEKDFMRMYRVTWKMRQGYLKVASARSRANRRNSSGKFSRPVACETATQIEAQESLFVLRSIL